jgi:hypothetical protein
MVVQTEQPIDLFSGAIDLSTAQLRAELIMRDPEGRIIAEPTVEFEGTLSELTRQFPLTPATSPYYEGRSSTELIVKANIDGRWQVCTNPLEFNGRDNFEDWRTLQFLSFRSFDRLDELEVGQEDELLLLEITGEGELDPEALREEYDY